ncbi:hypothetical protein NYR60_05220 [Actinobacillus genomosp. 2]|uniref:hypothetical protein n=1 Tax=Actinobacillus genomosp. 2 TaxID=230709 RepID=UPI0024435AB6|nr:hypothetical protein [Actinobacillus genomosp. 2]WGE31278.1 hypothetical protein NYR60_05220 [Actinobacillus genomosp. 2]
MDLEDFKYHVDRLITSATKTIPDEEHLGVIYQTKTFLLEVSYPKDECEKIVRREIKKCPFFCRGICF